MRQAVPLVRPEAPIVGTGLEEQVIKDSRILIVAEGDGVVEYVDANEIVIRYSRTDEEKFVSFDDDIKRYQLPKYHKTNQNTTINLIPIVRKGEKVVKGQVLTEGYGTKGGELALGRNLKVAFMPWKGYNFEDAIVISEKVVQEDIFTSVHIDEYLLEVRDTKRGMEELTSDMPNVSEEVMRDNRERRIVPVEMSVLAVGYEQDGKVHHLLPPRPPLSLDVIYLCEDKEIARFTEKFGYFRHILNGKDVPVGEVVAAHILQAGKARGAESGKWIESATQEVITLLRDDYPTLMSVLGALADIS